MADGDTPVSAYSKLGARDYSFLLESVVGGEKWAEYSFIGLSPRAVLSWRAGEAHMTSYHDGVPTPGGERRWKVGDPTEALAQVMDAWKPVDVPGLPRFWGGAVGWIGYDVVRSFERLPSTAVDDLGVPEMCVVLTDTLVVFDNLRQTIKVVVTPEVGAGGDAAEIYSVACRRIDEIVLRLQSEPPRLAPLVPPPSDEDASPNLRWGGGQPPNLAFSRG